MPHTSTHPRKSSENHQKSKKHRQVFLGITEDEDWRRRLHEWHQPSLLGDIYTWLSLSLSCLAIKNIPSHRVPTNCIALLVETYQKHPKTMSPVGELKHENDPASPFDKSQFHLLRFRSFSYARRVGRKNKHMEWATRVEAVPRCSRNPLRHIQWQRSMLEWSLKHAWSWSCFIFKVLPKQKFQAMLHAPKNPLWLVLRSAGRRSLWIIY